ncbi:polyisoprenoid-binding protein [Tabrizicola piscis]|uniref:Polyisoprenoid-binding protein n=1 Tax=Tabrizicola piscis TaxID=2494374 RepID=A0A3S8UAP2_9RHOB|nr:YceI family protein [Tabrizicola piscis]AZL60802.1 polyisoprenoid-binding protein [Tabrizicola piscis]
MTRFATLAAVAALAAAPALAAPVTYTIDQSHAQIIFSYNHVGYSTGYGMFSGFGGEVVYDAENPAASTVSVTFPVRSMLTGWEARFEHFMSPDFFDAAEDEAVSFTSTAIEVTGDTTGKITGDLTLNGVTKPVVLDATLNKSEPYPLPPFEGKPAVGFTATTTVLRSDFGLGNYVPFISDEVQIQISFEAMATE